MRRSSVVEYIKRREIDEEVRGRMQRRLHVTGSFVQRLGLEKELEGHQGCVNCLEWNTQGRILASASDDFHVILWDPFKYRKIQTIQTVHHGNIFSVKFLPGSGDGTVVTGAGDHQVHTVDVLSRETTRVCTCASGRVKRLATTPLLPHVFWSASEDGAIRQYDARASHSCSGDGAGGGGGVLVQLRSHLGHFAEAKCLAVHPGRPELLAVGANDPYVRLYDRRMIRLTKTEGQRSRSGLHSEGGQAEDNLPRECVQYFVPGHLPARGREGCRKYRSLAATYLTFSGDGDELLLNLGGEQIYLFNTDPARRHRPQTFHVDEAPALRNKEHNSSSNGYSNGFHSHSHAGTNGFSASGSDSKREEKKQKHKLPDHIEKMKLTANMLFEKEEYGPAIRLYNEAIELCANSPVLYGNRAAAYMKRDWDGDMYAALRDCHTTLTLDPHHVKAFFRLARCLHELRWTEQARQCLERFKLRFPSHVSSHACRALEKDIHMTATSAAEDADSCHSEPDMAMDEGWGGGSGGGGGEGVSTAEWRWREAACDYDQRYYGHCNTTTDIKEANFWGSEGQYIIAGSDDGSFYVWERGTANNVRILKGDSSIVNCLQPHPHATCCLLATSGIDPVVRLWSPQPQEFENSREVRDRDSAASCNQRRMKADPFDVVLMNMGYGRSGGDHPSDDAGPPTYNCQPS